MKRFARGLIFFTTLWMLSGCGGGSSANAPSGGVTVVAGDGRVTLAWAMEPNVDYWAFYVAGTSISSDNPTGTAGHVNLINVASPLIISGLVNGVTYAFTVNGRTKGGPGGSGTPSVTAVPRLAGSAWTVGNTLGAFNLNGVTYGTVGGNIFVAAGSAGKIASSLDGMTWTTLANASSADLNSVAFGGASYVAAGAGGVILYSTDGVNWAAESSATGNTIYSVAANGASTFVGVGANGTIVYGNGASWTAATSPTTKDLLAVAYGNGRYVAVGSAGTLLTSTDAINWTAASSSTLLNLKSIAFGINASTLTNLFVAVGASGAMITSPDGVTWTSNGSLPASSNINSVIYGTQFVLVGDSGIIYTSTDGASWQARASGTTSNLKAVSHNLSTQSYAAVGVSGTNLSAY